MRSFAVTVAIAAAHSAAVSAASAQGGWEFRLSADTLTPQEPSVTITLAVSFPAADFAFAGANWNVHATEPGWSDLERLPLQIPPTLFPCDPSCDGIVAGGDVTGISHGQLYAFGFIPDPSNPIALWRATFTVTDFSTAREIVLSTTTTRFEVYIEDLGPGSPRASRTPDEGRAIMRVIPAPAPLALLGIAAFVATCRRSH
jgi:hypothetical protein